MSWHIGDYKRDTGHLRAAEHGAYFLLIMHYWARGALPDDDRQLATIACMTDREWKAARPTLVAFFQPGWKHKRVEEEIADANEQYRRRSAAGRAGGIATANGKHCRSNATSNTEAGPPANEQQPITDNPKEEKKEATGSSEPVRSKLKYPAAFEGWWLAYPRTPVMSKKEAIAAWNRLPEPDRLLAVSALPKYAAFLKSNPNHPVVHACRFLSQRRFDGFDEAQGPAPEGSPPGFYAAFGAPELDAWDAYRMDFEGRKYPRDKRGGWSFPTRWPTGYEVKNGHGAHNGTGGAQEGTERLFGHETVPCDRSDAGGQPAAPARLARAFTIE